MSKYIVHQGGNSISKLYSSLELGMDGVECDLHMTKDKILVNYDFYFITHNNQKLKISELTYAEIEKINMPNLPVLFENILSFCVEKAMYLIVDVKNGPVFYDNIETVLTNVLKKYNHKHIVYVMSYDHLFIKKIKNNQDFKAKAGILYSAKLVDLSHVLTSTKSDFIQTNNYYLSNDVIEEVRQHNLEIIGWCTTNIEEIKYNIHRGIDFITIEHCDIKKIKDEHYIKDEIKFTSIALPIFEQACNDYHQFDNVDIIIQNPYPLKSIEYYLYFKNWIDTIQWHLEDIIRKPDIDFVKALEIKRRIDKSNQERTDLVELIDNYFLDKYKNTNPSPNAIINTESPAWAIDRLSILILKIYHMQVEVNRKDVEKLHTEKCREKLNILLEQRQDLSSAIDQLLSDIENGAKYMKVYKQIKMYNDPTLNPILYEKQNKF